MKLKNKKVLVYGLGDSGRAVIKQLNLMQAYVSFYDDDLKYYEYVGFERNPTEKFYDLVVVSPGVKIIGNEIIQNFVNKKILVISELDFGYLFCKGKILGITGTNGKTTVSMLTNKILKNAGFETFLCGNIGLPISSICSQTTKNSVVVCEVSNFQLETSKFFRADVACILNVRPDHLDRHGSFEEYKNVKAKIAAHLKRRDLLVLNLDDEEAKKMVFHKKHMFFSKKTLKKGVFCYKNQIFNNKKPIISISDIKLRGEKNLENVLASVALCSQFKIEKNVIENTIKNFVPAAHRMEIVGTVDGVTYVDDSKATNLASTIACVDAFKKEKIILLMGGLGKEIDYDEFFKLNYPIKKVICFGADGEKIYKIAKKYNYFAEIFEKFDDSVRFCKKNATLGDYVLLSPACASFDEFSSYAERGERFKSLILEHEND